MAVDNTHTKYLKGSDKKAWNTYKEAYEAQRKLGNFMEGLKHDAHRPKDLKEGEVYDIPLKRKN